MSEETEEKPGKFPIDRPCSACSAGDYEMRYHDHKPPFRKVEPTTTKFPVYKITIVCKDGMPHLKYTEQDLKQEIRRVIQEELMLNMTFFSVEEQKGEENVSGNQGKSI